MPPSPRSQALTQVRRVRYALRDIRWWAIFALVLAVVAVGLAFRDASLEQVVAVAAAAITLAILSMKETT